MKVMTILGTRPEIIKLSRVIAELDRHVSHVLVHTGQNFDFELNEIFFRDLELRKPDHFLEVGGGTLAESIGNVIIRADSVMEREKPDAILLLGDTNSCLSAIPAKRRKIPIFHMEAGNRSFDQRVPEEVNRKIVDHVSDINLTYTEHARRYLLREGVNPATVIKTGSPMREVLEYYRPGIERSDVLSRLALSPGEYFVVSAHREENVDTPEYFRDIIDTLAALANTHRIPVIVTTHPRTMKRLQETEFVPGDPMVRFLKPLGFFDYVKLQLNSRCVVSDSGTITEESSILGFPAVTIRQAHERPEGMDEGTLIMCGLKAGNVLKAIDVVVAQTREGEYPFRPVQDYEPRNVSKKVVRVILSYVEYVNRTTWYRSP